MAAVGGKCLAEEGLSSCDTSGLAQIEVNRSALLVYSPVQVVPVSLDVDEGLVNPPRSTDRGERSDPSAFRTRGYSVEPNGRSCSGPLGCHARASSPRGRGRT